jgi:hypothetical protein
MTRYEEKETYESYIKLSPSAKKSHDLLGTGAVKVSGAATSGRF